MLVDVVREKETGATYLIPTGDPLPGKTYERIAINMESEIARKQYIKPKINPKQKC